MSESEFKFTPESKEKPKTLFHGSKHSTLEQIDPQNRSYRDEHEGPRVFATPDERLAAIFMSDAVESGYFDGQPYAVLVGDPKNFANQDNGGAIYEFGPEGFESDPDKGLGSYEWTSIVSVSPRKKTD